MHSRADLLLDKGAFITKDLDVNTFKTHSHPFSWPFCSSHTYRPLKPVLIRTEFIIQ